VLNPSKLASAAALKVRTRSARYNVTRNCIVRAPTRQLVIYCTSLRRPGGGERGRGAGEVGEVGGLNVT